MGQPQLAGSAQAFSCASTEQPLASAYVVPHPTRPNEDTFCVCPLWLGALGMVSFFGVYDGHSGSEVSRFLAASLHHYVEACGVVAPNTAAALSRAFQAADSALEEATLNCPNAGSTATVALLSATEITVAHCGDSRALLCRGGRVSALTEDHRPERLDERERVLGSGGQILWNEGERVMGVLATTRAFGDRDLKQFGVTAEPEVTVTPRHPEDEFLILATDGVFHVLSNDEVADVARRVVTRAAQRGSPRSTAIRMAASAIGRFSRDRNSKDDITVVVVDLVPMAGPSSNAGSREMQAAGEVLTPSKAVAVQRGPNCCDGQSPFTSQEVNMDCSSSPQAPGTCAPPSKPPLAATMTPRDTTSCCQQVHDSAIPAAPACTSAEAYTGLASSLSPTPFCVRQLPPSGSSHGVLWPVQMLAPAPLQAIPDSPPSPALQGPAMLSLSPADVSMEELLGPGMRAPTTASGPYGTQSLVSWEPHASAAAPAAPTTQIRASSCEARDRLGSSKVVSPVKQNNTVSAPAAVRGSLTEWAASMMATGHSTRSLSETSAGPDQRTGSASGPAASMCTAGMMLPPLAGGIPLGLYRTSSVVAVVAGAHANAVESR